jgi:hypothetical protein
MITLDSNGNFIQEKYEPLAKYPSSPKYPQLLKTRIDMLNYPTVWNYIKLKESPDFEQVFVLRVKMLALMYGLEFNENKNPNTLDEYIRLIKAVITDIIRSRDVDDSLIEYLLENLSNRSEFVNCMSILKFE